MIKGLNLKCPSVGYSIFFNFDFDDKLESPSYTLHFQKIKIIQRFNYICIAENITYQKQTGFC